MTHEDSSFMPGMGLDRALELLRSPPAEAIPLPDALPETGRGELAALDQLAPHVIGRAARLGSARALAHMDPPTPWITWATALWNASLNQNLLHEATSPFASEAERRVIDWLRPYFGMSGGHFCAGSSIANLTALWAARESRGIESVVASESAHLSIEESARILGLTLQKVPVDDFERLDPTDLGNLESACLVLTAGTTATGAIDPLEAAGTAAWTHIDATWAGPLRLTAGHCRLVDGVDRADSVAISAHKWLFQPKDSAMLFLRDIEAANAAISFGGGYLAKPNVGLQGSRAAAAVPLLATLLAWGRKGIAARLDHSMDLASRLADRLAGDRDLVLWSRPETGITVFRPAAVDVDSFMTRIPAGMLSTCTVQGERWVRSVAANPMADVEAIFERILRACR